MRKTGTYRQVMKLTKVEAIYQFFAGFGVPAYEQNSVPDGKDRPEYPYITYELRTDSFGDYDTSAMFSVWDDNDSIERVVDISDSIARALGRIGKVIKCDEGFVLIIADSPFCDIRAEEKVRTIKRALCSVRIRYYTNF